jgi:hypothetical protein
MILGYTSQYKWIELSKGVPYPIVWRLLLYYYSINLDIIFWLVVSPPLKNMKVSWEYYSQYMGK